MNKQFVINSATNILINGTVDDKGKFKYNNSSFPFKFAKIHVMDILTLSPKSHNRVNDTLSISGGGLIRRNYNFTHSDAYNEGISISINYKFERINGITLNKGKNLPFSITYKSMFI